VEAGKFGGYKDKAIHHGGTEFTEKKFIFYAWRLESCKSSNPIRRLRRFPQIKFINNKYPQITQITRIKI
jgi:hypothetical protein